MSTNVLIGQLLDLPERVHKGDFVLNLSEGVTRPEATLGHYVVTDQLQGCFDNALGFIKSAIEARSSKAAYLHGSFGSGKSHFMAVLHLLLQHDPHARALPELAPICVKHQWAQGKRFLLVPYHMIGARSMESAILGGYAEHARKLHPEAPWPGIYLADDIFADARRYRENVGDNKFFALISQGAGGSKWGALRRGWTAESFEAAMTADPGDDARGRLVGDLIKHLFPAYQGVASGRGSQDFLSLDKGLSVLSRHARDLGYDALILFLDELILWLASHAAQPAFVHQEGQKLAKLVESQQSDRPIPIVSFVARQRDLRDLVGENMPGAAQLSFADALRHWEGRFHTITLEDRNLPVIAEKRVLKPKDEACRQELKRAFEQAIRLKPEVLETLLTHEADKEMFRQVYPFSPALVQTLVAVSSVLQRERTALKIMLQLLVEKRDSLRVGDLIPCGDLWDQVAHGEEAFSDVMRASFENAKRLYHNKLRPLLEEDNKVSLEHDRPRAASDPELARRLQRFDNDDRLVKTLLLSALVPEVEPLKNLTASRLAALNHGTIKAPPGVDAARLVLNKVRAWASRVG
ncbi:MAG: phage resistance protein, partial [Planctomycetaceae bacterium]|nr:phage resistance protein [Planctomycetaceae bacterium]